MRRFGVLFCVDGEDREDAGGARAWVVASTPASAKSASARTPTSLFCALLFVVREFRKRATQGDASVRRGRVRRVGFAGRAFGGGEDACVLESLASGSSRGVNPGTQRRRARVIDASSRRFSKTARTLRGPRLRSRRAASRAVRGFHVYAIETIRGVRTRGLPRASSSPRGTRARVSADFPLHVQRHQRTTFFLPPAGDPSSVAGSHVRRSLASPHRAACPRNAARREHEPRDDRPKPGRRGDPRAPARRRAPPVAAAVRARGWHRLQSLRRVGSPRHAVRGLRVRGGQDRQRAGRHPRRFAGRARARRGAPARLRAPARTHAFSVSRHTHPRTRVYYASPFLRLAGWRAFCALESRAPALRGFRGRRASLCNRARLTPSGLLLGPSPVRQEPALSRRRRRNASPAR